MFCVNDHRYGEREQQQFFQAFARHSLLGSARGKRIAACLADPAQWLALCLYLRQQGGSVFPIHPTTPREAAQRLARRAACHGLIFQDLEDSQLLDDRPADAAAVLLQMSSGTTGEPKCIERTWAAIDAEIQSYNAAFPAAGDLQPVVACPVTHSYGLICGVLAALARGQSPIVVTNMNPRYLLKRLAQCERPLLYAAPTLLTMLARLLPPGERLHAVMTSGALMSRGAFEELKRRSDHIFQQYGCSEVGCIALNPRTGAPHEVGYPLAHLKVSAGERAEVPAEIRVQLPGQAVPTRDLGYFDEDGMLCFLARLDDTINVAGINVYPQEVEDVVLEYADIQDAVVYKKADPYAGERVCLKFTAGVPVDTDRLRAWCATQLTPYQTPVDLLQVETLPRLANGKINRRQLARDPAPADA